MTREARECFYQLLTRLGNINQDYSAKFGYEVRKAFDAKITSDKKLPTYYLTKERGTSYR
jgi:hypothetical protein